MAQFPITLSLTGYVPQSPVTLNDDLINGVAALSPGYTARLPGIMIEDIASTDTFALTQLDSSVAEIIDSISPSGANAYLLNQLGTGVYGVTPQIATNTSVYVLFSGPAGFIIGNGYTVSDGTNQYIIQTGTIVATGGYSPLVNAVAVNPGSWAVPANTVNQIVTSYPSNITLTVNNPGAGTPSVGAETEMSFRSRTLTAGLAASAGMSRYLKTLLQNIPGVQANLVSVRQTSTTPSQWEVICGGSGNQYLIAYAIYQALFDLNNLTGSVMTIAGITNANPGVVTTGLNHGYANGQIVTMYQVGGMTTLNGVPQTITVITGTTFSISNTTLLAPYTTGGYCTPNLRNVAVSVVDYPDTYVVTYVNPPQQIVTSAVTWNTNSPNYVNPAAIAQAANPALIDYINTIPVGQPLNVFDMNAVFQAATANILPTQYLTRLVFSVSINGVPVAPSSGTGIIAGDPESYFYAVTSGIVISQG